MRVGLFLTIGGKTAQRRWVGSPLPVRGSCIPPGTDISIMPLPQAPALDRPKQPDSSSRPRAVGVCSEGRPGPCEVHCVPPWPYHILSSQPQSTHLQGETSVFTTLSPWDTQALCEEPHQTPMPWYARQLGLSCRAPGAPGQNQPSSG